MYRGTDNTVIAGNYLGTDVTGAVALSASDGITSLQDFGQVRRVLEIAKYHVGVHRIGARVELARIEELVCPTHDLDVLR